MEIKSKIFIHYISAIVVSVSILASLSFLVVNHTLAAGCNEACIQTSNCTYTAPTPASGGTVTCVSTCGTSYCTGSGFCACTTMTSTHCPPDAWTAWGACVGGFQMRFCSTYGADSQIQPCTPGGTGIPGGPTPTPKPTGSSTNPSPTPDPTCTISLGPNPTNLTLGGTDGTITATVSCSSPINSVNFSSSNTAAVTITSTAIDTTSPYTATVHGVALGTSTITGTVYIDGIPVKSATATVNVVAPACTITLSPGTTNVTLGGATGTITANVSCNINIDTVRFSSGNPAAVTVSPTTVTPGAVKTATVVTNATGVAVGSSIITGSVYVGGSGTPNQSGTAIVNAAPLSAWFQVKDADVTSGSDLSTHVQAPQVFGLAGAGGYPGVPVYQNVTDLTPPSKASTLSWIAKNTATNQRIYDYKTLTAQIPSDVVPNVLPATVTDANFSAAVGPYGYTWYKYSGGGVTPLTISGAISIGATEKVILLVDSADLLINAPITVANGGFFMVVVGETSTGAKGNITVAATVGGGAAPNLEGIYVADNVFSDSAGNLPLWIRGSVAGYGGVQLLRDLVAGNFSSPAELIEFAPDQILLYPSKLSARKLNWKEVAP